MSRARGRAMVYWGFKPYVPVARRKSLAASFVKKLAKRQRREPAPVAAQMPKSIWGKAWADHLESFSDYANRLPRGRTYLRNGSVLDLVIGPKRIDAVVAGSSTYQVRIEIVGLAKTRWAAIRSACASGIDSILDLMAGRLSDSVMGRLVDAEKGIFPTPAEIKLSCSCPDWSSCCKHIAAVMYGVGTRLDSEPELLFVLRGVDHQQLVQGAMRSGALERELSRGGGQLASEDLGAIFGIELDGQVVGGADAGAALGDASAASGPATRKAAPRAKSRVTKSPATKSPRGKTRAASKTTQVKPTRRATRATVAEKTPKPSRRAASARPAAGGVGKPTPEPKRTRPPKAARQSRRGPRSTGVSEPASSRAGDREITSVSIPPELLQEMLAEAGFDVAANAASDVPSAAPEAKVSKKGRRPKAKGVSAPSLGQRVRKRGKQAVAAAVK